jgi:hypothetical protein
VRHHFADRRNSVSRTLSPIAFFHHNVTNSDTDLRYNSMGAERRARAIATAPRRKRYDDDDGDTGEKRSMVSRCLTQCTFSLSQ